MFITIFTQKKSLNLQTLHAYARFGFNQNSNKEQTAFKSQTTIL